MSQQSLSLPQHPTGVGQPPRAAAGRFAAGPFLARVALVALVIAAAVAGIRPLAVPPALPSAATPGAFSVTRALADLQAITAAPRAPGTPGLAAAQQYLAAELAALGLEVQVGDELMVEQHGEHGVATIAQSHNVVARLPGTDSSGAIVVAGHLDSVHTTTGASDCGGCAVAVVETARALVAGPALRNDVVFLIEDGEETTRAGSLAFVERHPWAKDVRVAVNQESMGSAGASMMYVTGPDSGWLVGEALKAMPHSVAYSFVNDLVWKTGTGGSDLDQLLMVAPVGLGLIYLENVPAYHTMQDSVASLDPRSLQHQGENVLALVRHFGNLPLDGALTAPDTIYFTLAGGLTVHHPGWVAQLLALASLLGYGVLLAVGLRRRRLHGSSVLAGALALVPAVLIATTGSTALWQALRLLDPRLQVFLIGITYDRPWYTLAFALLSAALVIGLYSLFRRRAWRDLGMGALAWWVVLALLTAWGLPGSSPAFTIPTLLALLPAGVAVFGLPRPAYLTALGIAAAGSMLLVAPMLNFLGIFSGRAELIMGLPVIGLLPGPLAALLAALFLPLWDELGRPNRWSVAAACFAAALLIVAGVGLSARFTPERPKPNMIAYVAEAGQAEWVTVAGPLGTQASLVDEWTVQFLGSSAEATTFTPWGAYFVETANPALRAPAPQSTRPAPQLHVLAETMTAAGQRQLQARLELDTPVPMLVMRVETTGAESGLIGLQVLGQPLEQMASPDRLAPQVWLEFYGINTNTVDLELTVQGTGAVEVWVEERLFELPAPVGTSIQPRPAWMIPAPTFISDSSLLRTSFVLP